MRGAATARSPLDRCGNASGPNSLASDTVATAAVGLNGTAFGLLTAFTTSVVGVCQFVVGRKAGDGDEGGARAAARQALLLAGAGGSPGPCRGRRGRDHGGLRRRPGTAWPDRDGPWCWERWHVAGVPTIHS
jgi:hypothetical protein